MREWLNIRKTQPSEIRQRERAGRGDMTKRVATHVSVVGGVRQFADSDAVEHYPDNSPKSFRPRSHLHLVQA